MPISFCDINAYCQIKAIYSLSDRERLLRFVDVLDRQWMKDSYDEKNKAVTEPPEPDIPRRSRRPPTKKKAP